MEPQLRIEASAGLALNSQIVEAGKAIHIIHYDYDSGKDQAPGLEEVSLELRPAGKFNGVEVFTPGEPPNVGLKTILEDLHSALSQPEERSTLRYHSAERVTGILDRHLIPIGTL